MMSAFAALADRSRLVDGTPTSLADLGYSDAGIDDYWQLCGSYGPNNYTYHLATGEPVVDTTKFPSLKGMCDAAHALNLTCGWYGNNCGCHDHCTDVACFAGDINAAIAFGFDSWKLDGCGAEENVELFYTASKWATQKAGRKPFLIENCECPSTNTAVLTHPRARARECARARTRTLHAAQMGGTLPAKPLRPPPPEPPNHPERRPQRS